MIVAFDTNVILRLLLADDEHQLNKARAMLATVERIILPLAVLCEAVWVMRASYRIPGSVVADNLENFIADERVVVEADAADAGIALLRDGGDFADAVIAAEGRRMGASGLVTFDKAAARLLQAQGEPVTLLG